MEAPNYRAFAREMMKLCKKHGIKILACDEGTVLLGPADGKTHRDYPYSSFEFSPTLASIGESEGVVTASIIRITPGDA